MKIRLFEERDTRTVIALWETCGLTRPWNDPQEDIERCVASGQGLFLVSEEAGTIVGAAMGGYGGHRGWVYYLAVHPDRRRERIGQKIMSELESLLKKTGCPKINLMIRDGNDDVIDFYSQVGYKQNPVIVMSKRLIEDR